MVPDHLVHEQSITDEHLVLRGERRIPYYRHLRRYRICLLLALALLGLHLLATAPGAGNNHALTAQRAVPAHTSIQTAQGSASETPLSVGMGAGISFTGRTAATLPAASCNPFDVICWLTNAAQWIGQQILNALQSVNNGLLHGPLDIITQTPPSDTYQNGTVIIWSNAFLAVVDLALASLIVIGGYNVIVGRGLGLPHSALPEFLPRRRLAFGAAHFSLFFLGLFIDLENALSGVALDLASHSMLTNVIAGIFQGNLLGEGFLVVVLAIVLGVMSLLLGAQMVVRLALLWVLLVLSGPGLACFALPQTMGFGRLWLSLTASTVMVQFFQVVALGLGGTLLISLGASNLSGLDGTLATLLVAAAMLYLVLRIPGIVHRYAFRPMMDASTATAGAIGGAAGFAVGFAADVAPRLLALL
jgi:hypothetical protein